MEQEAGQFGGRVERGRYRKEAALERCSVMHSPEPNPLPDPGE
jgi:hypothetical protein